MDITHIVPGLYDSGAGHWQSWFETVLPNCTRVIPTAL
jgi:predicted alpha/beta hydrolase family esterase